MNETHKVIAKQYLQKIKAFKTYECNPEDPKSNSHLSWMLHVIRCEIYDPAQESETKMNRWLGYVQGVMVAKGMIKVNEERDRTRAIFNGK